MAQTIFEKVISGEFEGSFIHKDDFCVAFMDLHPLNVGHVLVVPRKAIERVSDLEPSLATHLFLVAQKILKAIESSELHCEGANLFISDGEVAGQEVPHVHIHIVPRFAGDGMRVSFGKSFRKAPRAELDSTAVIIRSALEASPGL